MRYLSVCSGIESASAAWHELGWQPVAYAEIEKFPSALLAERYPGVQNLGDMTRYAEWPLMALDALVGGTPCQSFSVAGQRGSLDDERGNLTLVFCRIADRFNPEFVVWENVPGVLSTVDNAFGCFLGELTGCDTAIDPGRVRWTSAGVVAGPKRTAAWRVINAEGFVPQRRSRVFVVAARAGSRIHPADVLFETEAEAFEHLGERAYTGPLFPLPESVRGDSEESDEAGQETTGALGAGSKRSGGRVGRREAAAGQLVARSLRARHNATHRDDSDTYVAHSLRAGGFDASEDGTGRGTPLVVATAEGGRSVNLTRSNIGKQIHNQSPLLVFQHKASANQSMNPQETAPAMDVAKSDGLAIAIDITNALAGDDLSGTLEAAQYKSNRGQGVMAFQEAQTGVREYATAGALRADGPGHDPVGTRLRDGMVVRRLTPTECERLMGVRDGYTLINYRGKPAKDGPRYKALGNSMVRDVMLWIGRRIERLA